MEAGTAVAWWTYIIIIIIATEIFAYLWHRFGAHDDILPGLHSLHKIHHEADLTHEADADFIIILALIVMFELIMGIAVMIQVVPVKIAIVTIIVSIIIFSWNWWIHRAYHQPDHWLNKYEWFLREKDLHYIHHDIPTMNYGIASHFMDKILGSWTSREMGRFK